MQLSSNKLTSYPAEATSWDKPQCSHTHLLAATFLFVTVLFTPISANIIAYVKCGRNKIQARHFSGMDKYLHQIKAKNPKMSCTA
jgi:hypothetical protein